MDPDNTTIVGNIKLPTETKGDSDNNQKLAKSGVLSQEQNDEITKIINSRLKKLNSKALFLKNKIADAENKIKDLKIKSNYVQWLTVGITIAFFIALVFLVFDYFKLNDNSARINLLEESSKNWNNSNLQLNCLKNKGYFSVKCFEF